jgi:hypothetical protein
VLLLQIQVLCLLFIVILMQYCIHYICICSFSVTDSRNFHTAVAKVKSGKGTSVFTERTDDSSAMQYFQVLTN